MTTPPNLHRELGLKDLILFNISAVVGIRWLATAAHVGPSALSLWVLAAGLFFIPSAFAVAALSRKFPQEGGFYIWTKEAFGEGHAFFAGWTYWLSNLFFYPQLLLSGIGMTLYAFEKSFPGISQNRTALTLLSLVALWTALLTNMVGLKIGKWTENIGGLATYAVAIIAIGLGAMVAWRFGMSTHLVLLPHFQWDRLNFLSQMAFAFGGLELGAVLGGEIRDPEKNLPRAAWISGGSVALFYMLGTAAILAVLKPESVDVMQGLIRAIAAAESHLGGHSLSLIAGLLIGIGITGTLGAWAGGSARIPFVMNIDKHLPKRMARLHPKWGTPYLILIFQGVASSLFLVMAEFGSSLKEGYQLLVDMTVITYFIPFIYIFLAALKLTRTRSAALGLLVTTMGIAFSLIPAEGVTEISVFEMKLLGGMALMMGSAWYVYRARSD